MRVYRLRLFLLFFILLFLLGCLNPPEPKVVEIKFDVLSISKNGSNYDAAILVKSISGDRVIPMDAFFVDTDGRIFMLSDSSNVTVIRGNTNALKADDVYVIHLKPSDRYLDIHPQSHDLRILARLLVEPDSDTFGNATKYIVNPEWDKREGFIVPQHKACYVTGRVILLDDWMIGSRGTVLYPNVSHMGVLAEENVTPESLNLRKGFTLKRIIYDVVGGDTLGIVMAIDKNGYGFSIEVLNDNQGAFLFAPIQNEREALNYLRFLMHDVQHSVMGRHYKDITSQEMFEDVVNTIKEHCQERGERVRVLRMPPSNVTTVKAESDRYIIDRVYFTEFPEKIEYVKAIVYKNGRIDIIEMYDCIVGTFYVRL